MEQITRKQVHLMGSAPTYEELETLIKEKMYWKEVHIEESDRYEARWGKVYDVSNAKGRLDGTLIIKPNKARWGIYYIN